MTEEKIAAWKEEIKKLETGLQSFCRLNEFKFKQNLTGAEDPAFDDRGWEVRKDTRWSMNEGPAYFCKKVNLPKSAYDRAKK